LKSVLKFQYLTRFFIKKIECESDNEFITNPICRIKAISRNVQTITSSMEVIKPIKKVWVWQKNIVVLRKCLKRASFIPDQCQTLEKNLH
jgi:hypothetical protein